MIYWSMIYNIDALFIIEKGISCKMLNFWKTVSLIMLANRNIGKFQLHIIFKVKNIFCEQILNSSSTGPINFYLGGQTWQETKNCSDCFFLLKVCVKKKTKMA